MKCKLKRQKIKKKQGRGSFPRAGRQVETQTHACAQTLSLSFAPEQARCLRVGARCVGGWADR